MKPCAAVVYGYFLLADLADVGAATDAAVGFEDKNGAVMALQFFSRAESGEACTYDDCIILLILAIATGVVTFRTV